MLTNFLLWRTVSYGRASQRLKKDDWEMRKWRNKKETIGTLKGCYCFSSLLWPTSFICALSCLEQGLLFYFLAQLDFIAKNDASGCASSQVFLCLPCCLSGCACPVPYMLWLNSMYISCISCSSLRMHTSHPQQAFEAIHYHLAYCKSRLSCKSKNKDALWVQNMYADSYQESPDRRYFLL